MNDNTVIHVENLGKSYLINHQKGNSARGSTGYRRFSEELVSFGALPYRKLRRLFGKRCTEAQSSTEEFWALTDVSFDIRRGDAVGIIGRNGAGKSTLLKILSRITEPSLGRVEIDGRVASLLEVGTGFHTELTGRENIYLNGAILGMTRKEIARKFDEIVDFAEVEKFLDTPVKRYSSGMYVRLAFAVAAHLEPEILIVDEVLSVGDAQFQKKSLGKMEAMGKEARTVLFVSHNLSVVQNLCSRCIVLDRGRVGIDGAPDEAIGQYTQMLQSASYDDLSSRPDRRGQGDVRFVKVELLNKDGAIIKEGISGEKLIFRLYYKSDASQNYNNCRISVVVWGFGHSFFLASTDLVSRESVTLSNEGYVDCIIDELPLTKGEYYCTVYLDSNMVVQDWVEAAVTFSVSGGDFYGTGRNCPLGWEGKTVLVKHRWEC